MSVELRADEPRRQLFLLVKDCAAIIFGCDPDRFISPASQDDHNHHQWKNAVYLIAADMFYPHWRDHGNRERVSNNLAAMAPRGNWQDIQKRLREAREQQSADSSGEFDRRVNIVRALILQRMAKSFTQQAQA